MDNAKPTPNQAVVVGHINLEKPAQGPVGHTNRQSRRGSGRQQDKGSAPTNGNQTLQELQYLKRSIRAYQVNAEKDAEVRSIAAKVVAALKGQMVPVPGLLEDLEKALKA